MIRPPSPFQTARRLIGLIALSLGATLVSAPGQPYKIQALAEYNSIVTRQKDYQRYEARLPADFPLGEGALVAFLEHGEVRGIVVQYAGARSGDWQEFYYRGGNPFFVFSKYYNLQSKLLFRNRFYLNDKREPMGWEINEVPQAIKGEAALLATSRILEDSRQIFQLVTDGLQASAKAAQVAPPSIVDALNDPENVPRALAVNGTALPLPPGVEPAKKDGKPAADPKAAPTAEGETAKPAELPPSKTEAGAPSQTGPLQKSSDDPVDPELARWAAWANATREHKEAITPFPAELVLGKIDVPPLPEPETPVKPDQASTEPPHPPVASGPAPLPPPAGVQ